MTSVEPADHQVSAPVVTVLGAGTMGRAWSGPCAGPGCPSACGTETAPRRGADRRRGGGVRLARRGGGRRRRRDHHAARRGCGHRRDRRAAPAPGTVWLQTSTVGLDGAERTIALARELGVEFVDSPVMGTRKPAEEGALVFLASGSESARARLAPVFDALGRKTLWLGEAGAGSRLKLACNAWVLMLTAGVAQSIALARALGVEPQEFFEAIAGGPLDSPYARAKGALILSDEYPVSFALSGAVKDGRLIGSALRGADVSDRLMAAVIETLEAASGRVTDPTAFDMSAVIGG